MERMDTVVPAVVAAAVVNAAARYNRNIGAVRNVEIIVNKIRHTGNADDNRDKYFSPFVSPSIKISMPGLSSFYGF